MRIKDFFSSSNLDETDDILVFDVLSKTNPIAKQIEICRLATACIRGWIEDADLIKFKEKHRVEVKKPSGVQGTKTIFVPYVETVIGDDDSKIYTLIWDASDAQVESIKQHPKEKVVKRAIMTRGYENEKFFGSKYLRMIGDPEEGEAELFTDLYNELMRAYTNKQKADEPKNDAWASAQTWFEEFRGFCEKCMQAVDFSEKQHDYHARVLEKVLACRDDATVAVDLFRRVWEYSYSFDTGEQLSTAESIKKKFELDSTLFKVYPDLHKILCNTVDEYFRLLAEKQEQEARKAKAEQEVKNEETKIQVTAEKLADDYLNGVDSHLSEIEEATLNALNQRLAEQGKPLLTELPDSIKERLGKKGKKKKKDGGKKGTGGNSEGNNNPQTKPPQNKPPQGQSRPPAPRPNTSNEPQYTGGEVIMKLIEQQIDYDSGMIPPEFDNNPGKSFGLSEINDILKRRGLGKYQLSE